MTKSKKRKALESEPSKFPLKKSRHQNDDNRNPGKSKTTKIAQKVRVDDLKWKEVTIPEQLDDYEGFLGLDEIDDVEVVRDESTGQISFTSRDVPVGGQNGNQAPPKSKGNSAQSANAVDSEEKSAAISESEEEWEGFSDELEPRSVSLSNGVADESEMSESNIFSSKIPSNKPTEAEELGNLPFEGLEDEDLEDGLDMSEWDSLNLSDETLSCLSNLKFSRPTSIQSASIPEIMAGHDVIGKASTGSGKTLAFGIPILEKFLSKGLSAIPSKRTSRKDGHPPLALILSPTRELAHQIGSHLTALCSLSTLNGPRIAIITGGLSIQKQERLLSSSHIIVGTPGRLWEVMSSAHGATNRLKKVQFLVIDEADRLLSEGHFKELEEILNALDRHEHNEDEQQQQKQEFADDELANQKRKRQTLVFSATFHKGLQQKLAGKANSSSDLMNKKDSIEYLLSKIRFQEESPKFIDVNPISQLAEGIKEGLVECPGTEKDLYLYSLLLLYPRTRTLVFTNSISAVRRLIPYLQNLNLPALALHSNMQQKARLQAIERFSARDSAILIATDVAARGLDIPGVQLVIHYHLPRTADMYVHRSGRTARAESRGASILLCSPEEVAGVRRLVARVHSLSGSSASKYFIRSLDVDKRVVTRVKPRSTLAKKIADVGAAKEKGRSQDKWLREAAEELGVEYDSEEMETMGAGSKGRGSGRRRKEKQDRDVGKAQLAAWKSELNALLSQRVNLGISERYLTGGTVDIDALLRKENGEFLGVATPLDLDSL